MHIYNFMQQKISNSLNDQLRSLSILFAPQVMWSIRVWMSPILEHIWTDCKSQFQYITGLFWPSKVLLSHLGTPLPPTVCMVYWSQGPYGMPSSSKISNYTCLWHSSEYPLSEIPCSSNTRFKKKTLATIVIISERPGLGYNYFLIPRKARKMMSDSYQNTLYDITH